MHAKLRAEDLYNLSSDGTTRGDWVCFSLRVYNLQRTQNLLDYTGSMEIHSNQALWWRIQITYDQDYKHTSKPICIVWLGERNRTLRWHCIQIYQMKSIDLLLTGGLRRWGVFLAMYSPFSYHIIAVCHLLTTYSIVHCTIGRGSKRPWSAESPESVVAGITHEI